MRVVLAGGSTGGATTPLLAIASELRRTYPGVQFLFLGTKRGPEQTLVTAADIPFVSISAGKLRRYVSIKNLVDVLRVAVGFFQAYRHLRRFRPDVIVSVGGFVAVPIVWSGWFLGIPSLIHQQDILPSLTNRLCSPVATTITVAFETSLNAFPRSKTRWAGNPIRAELFTGRSERARERFELRDDLPLLLAFGGGTGALRLNQLVAESGLTLVRSLQILHITGGRQDAFRVEHPNYHVYEFLAEDMPDAYAAADIVVCRAGLSTLSELAALGKPAIVIPLPDSHQEANAVYFERNRAVVVLRERGLTHEVLARTITRLLEDRRERELLRHNIRKLARLDASQSIVREITQIALPREMRRVSANLQRKASTVRPHEPLSRHTHFRIGGPADLFVVCRTRDEIVNTMRYLWRHQVPYVILGGGANVVVPDPGFRGVVVQLKNVEFAVNGTEVVVGAGMNTGNVASQCLRSGLVGLEFIVGIYGSIGGAVRGNAGAFGREMRDVVTSCEVLLPNGSLATWTNDDCRFGYRESLVKHSQAIIVTVRLKLGRGDTAAARKSIAEYTSYKRIHQPLTRPSAGCMFMNYHLQSGDDELREKFSSYVRDDRIPAWAFIVEAGLAGRRIGDVEISEQHANFFINHGHGTAEQVITLVSLAKQKVRERFGVQLREEVQFLGFS